MRDDTDPAAVTPPEPSARVLDDFIAAARMCLGGDLAAAVLFGSGAEDALRPESDVNLVLVLRSFSGKAIEKLRDPLRLAPAARLEVMFLLEGEITEAAEAFSVKFADISRRRRVLFGSDPFEGLKISDEALRRRLSQSLLNLALRLREAWALHGGNDDEAARAVANFTGPLRAAAASILSLERADVPPPREALRRMALALPGEEWPALVESLSAIRERRPLEPGEAARILGRLPEFAIRLRERAGRVP